MGFKNFTLIPDQKRLAQFRQPYCFSNWTPALNFPNFYLKKIFDQVKLAVPCRQRSYYLDFDFLGLFGSHFCLIFHFWKVHFRTNWLWIWPCFANSRICLTVGAFVFLKSFGNFLIPRPLMLIDNWSLCRQNQILLFWKLFFLDFQGHPQYAKTLYSSAKCWLRTL